MERSAAAPASTDDADDSTFVHIDASDFQLLQKQCKGSSGPAQSSSVTGADVEPGLRVQP